MQKSCTPSVPHVPILPLVAQALCVERDGRRLLGGIDLTLAALPGVTALLGPNGAGKSLLLQVLTGLFPPDTGSIRWAGEAPSCAISKRIGYVFQKPVLLRRSVRANILFSLSATGCPKDLIAARAQGALETAGLAELAEQPARRLSGGEQQRLALARAIATEPQLLVLDEPTAHLDPASVAAIEQRVRHVAAAGCTILLVTHDIAQARRLARTVIFMHGGRILETAQAADFFSSPTTSEARAYLAGELLA